MARKKGVFSRATHASTRSRATSGGSRSATHAAEERMRATQELDPLVDPKGPAHLGPVRLSLPRFVQREDGLWELAMGLPMPEETLLDTTGSMGDNVDLAMGVLPSVYEAYTTGRHPALSRYDVQMASGVFGDVYDRGTPVLCRSQFEMGDKISLQMTMMVPSRDGRGNHKEDPQFGIFGAAYLTKARIWDYGLRGYHFLVTDEPVDENIDPRWLKKIFGDDVIERLKENGHDFKANALPNLAATVKHLLGHTHAFVLLVDGHWDHPRPQWERLYGEDRVVILPGNRGDATKTLHLVKAAIVGLTEGTIDLESARNFLLEHGAERAMVDQIVHAVSRIPLGAQKLAENFHRIPVAGDVFRSKTDLWPMTDAEIAEHNGEDVDEDSDEPEGGEVDWL